jgi:predicted transcriptional regulator of viral defense system
MAKKDELDTILDENSGYLKVSNALKAGISRSSIRNYIIEQGLERVADGLYLAQDAWPDGMYVIQARYPQAVFSHESALFLLDLADRAPTRYSVTLKKGASASRLSKEGIRVYKVKSELFELGLSEAESPAGHTLRTYNAERSICDMIRSRSSIEIQDLQTALKEYMRTKDKDIPQLVRYAKAFSVEKAVLQYLEVL